MAEASDLKGPERTLSMIPHEDIFEIFVEIADTLVSDFDLIEFLTTLAVRSVYVSGADAAGVLLNDGRGHLNFIAASNEEARAVEIFQSQAEQGPCFDAFTTGEPVVNLHLDSTDARMRWPVFAPVAVELGFEAVHALPLRLRSERIGAMNLFSSAASDLDESGVLAVRALADVATISIIYERSLQQVHSVTEQLQGALKSRIAIEQAKGALSQRFGVPPEEAFDLLRTFARYHRHKIGDVAARIVNDPKMLGLVAQHNEQEV